MGFAPTDLWLWSIKLLIYHTIKDVANRVDKPQSLLLFFDFYTKARILLTILYTYKNFMVSVAQLAEHQIVALGAMGSSPITHPSLRL